MKRRAVRKSGLPVYPYRRHARPQVELLLLLGPLLLRPKPLCAARALATRRDEASTADKDQKKDLLKRLQSAAKRFRLSDGLIANSSPSADNRLRLWPEGSNP
jgi:hypothetical protein